MSLRGFHIFFIVCAILLSLFFGYWALTRFYTLTAVGAFLTAVGLIVYECYFIRKVNLK